MNVKSIFKKKSRVVEVDSSFYLFLVGVVIGVIFFFTPKALWIFSLYMIFILSQVVHDFFQIYFAEKSKLRLKKYVIYPFATKKMFGEDFKSPKDELIYALIGLAVYFGIMVLSYLIAIKFFPSLWPETITLQNTITAQTFDDVLVSHPFFSIFWINFLLFIFNLLIFAVPMDGGRILRSILTYIFGESSANKLVPYISKIVAFILVLVGLIFWDFIVIIFGIIVYFVSAKESKEVEVIALLSGKSINDFVTKEELIFNEDISILDAFTKMREKLIPEALVKYGNKTYGVVDADLIASVPKDLWGSRDIGSIANVVDPTTDKEKLGYIAQYLVEKNLSLMPVIHSRTKVLIGVIKRSDLADYLKIHKLMS